MSRNSQLGFNNRANLLQENMNLFHDTGICLLTLICVFVIIIGGYLFFSKLSHRNLRDHQFLETIWTAFPALLLIGLAIPSLSLLYESDQKSSAFRVLKRTGHQWYWDYSQPGFNSSTDIYIIKRVSRCLEVDNRPVLNVGESYNIRTTRADVIHAWALPSLAVKIDSVPGRINSSVSSIDLPGLFYGQCREICGANHSFMPVVLEVV